MKVRVLILLFVLGCCLLGIQYVGWLLDPQSDVHSVGGPRLVPYDMTRTGYLYLNGAMWDGQQLLLEYWGTDATRNILIWIWSEQGPGYLWWMPDASYCTAQGCGGQFIVLVPDEALIIVLTGD